MRLFKSVVFFLSAMILCMVVSGCSSDNSEHSDMSSSSFVLTESDDIIIPADDLIESSSEIFKISKEDAMGIVDGEILQYGVNSWQVTFQKHGWEVAGEQNVERYVMAKNSKYGDSQLFIESASRLRNNNKSSKDDLEKNGFTGYRIVVDEDTDLSSFDFSWGVILLGSSKDDVIKAFSEPDITDEEGNILTYYFDKEESHISFYTDTARGVYSVEVVNNNLY